AEDRFLVRGLLDAEIWKTDDGSRLLSRDDGEAAPVGRLRLWAAGDFAAGLQGFVLGAVEGGDGIGEEETEAEIEQAYLRYNFRSRPLRLEAGVLPTPIGNFSRRYFSSANPLIGSPDGYSVAYPAGVQLTGRAAKVDYRVAMVDGPLVNEAYVPEPGAALRPMLALGVNPVTGTRLGVYGTRGPYLGGAVEAMLPAGRGWKEYGQSVVGLDASFSRGHFELQADFARSRYEVPGFARNARGTAWFVEPKYTFTPRLFAALRYERNDYPYIQPVAPGVWIGSSAAFEDIEIGAGVRLAPGAVLKIAYRTDRWDVGGAMAPQFPDGWSVAAQLSYTFDVLSWFERPR
ncbi:MAG: hypothetical protein ACRD6R_13335, partial [Candidatus Polarisedimenticolia bacterium]